MLLKSIKLRNFRQFIDEQTVTFADDYEKNVTIIMGENGTGKTTLAQAFTWCLYGETDFEDKILLCKAKSQKMASGQTETVRVELALTHKEIEYTIISEQKYRKSDKKDKQVDTVGQRDFKIIYKKNGQIEYVKQNQLSVRIKEILPAELARYFFFDGERITIMSKRLAQGKGDEFVRAVRGLLGLDALMSAIDHLKKTIKDYDKKYDTGSDVKMEEYARDIDILEKKIEKNEIRISEIENEETPVTDRINELNVLIEKNKVSAELSKTKSKLKTRCETLVIQKEKNIDSLLSVFKKSPAYFARKMIHDSLIQLTETRKIEKSVPYVNEQTINHLINNGRCICGSEICMGNAAFNTLNELLNYVPPNSIGDSISHFKDICRVKVRDSYTMFLDFTNCYSNICACESDLNEAHQEIIDIDKQLLGLDDIGKLQTELQRYEIHFRDLHNEKIKLHEEIGGFKTDYNRIKTERDKLVLKDDNNRRVLTYREYAQYILNTINKQYTEAERNTRIKLENKINDIFHSIFGEGFTLTLNEKYDVNIVLNDIGSSTETSMAQNISIIFAFIAGVIQMARESREGESKLLISEPYPLVMDAPLSAFDKARIKTVCEVLPQIAEQVIIFIKDTDGEIAEEYLSHKIGKRLTFDSVNNSKIETIVR
ncbi:MAG: AAA family ATPase [Candidatus Cloacimonetes bacterium]|nr:AAA family ATPase [Candidatus Cloacimonadota bacterium]